MLEDLHKSVPASLQHVTHQFSCTLTLQMLHQHSASPGGTGEMERAISAWTAILLSKSNPMLEAKEREAREGALQLENKGAVLNYTD